MGNESRVEVFSPERKGELPYITPGSEVFIRTPMSRGVRRAKVRNVPVLTFDYWSGKYQPYSASFLADNREKITVINMRDGIDPFRVDGVMLWVGGNAVVVWPACRMENKVGNLVRVETRDNDGNEKEMTLPRIMAVAGVHEGEAAAGNSSPSKEEVRKPKAPDHNPEPSTERGIRRRARKIKEVLVGA